MKATPTAPILVIRRGRIVDPAQGIDRVDDVTIVGGRIERIGPADPHPRRTVDARGLLVCPGLIDMHVHLREPGGTETETIETGTAAAAAGGFTAVACMPNTEPPIADPETVRWVLDRARAVAKCRVYPVAAMTVARAGRMPVDMAALKRAGAVAFSDDGGGIDDDQTARAVIEQARATGSLVIQHCEFADIAAGGCVNLGRVSRKLGVPGIDPRAEDEMIARDLSILRDRPTPYHVAHISTAGAVNLVRQAKADGLPVTAEVTVHHLLLTEDAVVEHHANAKMSPPLRTAADVAACREGLRDGTIDCIVTDHAPHTAESKATGLTTAPFGIIGLESAWSLVHGGLVETRLLSLSDLVERMSRRPAQILGLSDQGTLAPGTAADVALIDPEARWTLDVTSMFSKSNNSPFLGRTLTGRCAATIVNGTIKYVARGWAGRFREAP